MVEKGRFGRESDIWERKRGLVEKGRFGGEREFWWRKGGLVEKGRFGRETEVLVEKLLHGRCIFISSYCL